MSEDPDFDMEVVGDDELGEMGGDDASGIVEDSHLEREGSEDATNSSESDELTLEESFPTINPDVVGWLQINLGELASFQNGNAFSKSDWGEEGYPIIRIQNLTGEADEYNHYDGELEARYRVEPGDTLLTWSGTIGAFSWKGPPAALNQHIFKVETGSEVNDSFFQFKLEELIPQLEALSHGSTMKHVRKADLVNIDIELPPLPEQRKIASVLYAVDQAIQKTEAIIEQEEKIYEGAKRDLMRNGYFDHSGRRNTATGSYPNGWRVARGDEVFSLRSGEFLDSSKRKENGRYPVYGGNGIMGFTDQSRVPEGTVVIGRVGAYCGNVHITVSPAWVTDNAILVEELSSTIKPGFLVHVLDQVGLNRFAEQSAQPRISQSTLRNLKIPIPSEEEQEEIVDSLRTMKKATESERRLQNDLQVLKEGLMQDLLTGEVRTMDKAIEVLGEVKAHG